MKPQSNPDPSLRNPGTALPNSSAAPAAGYAPTVPMSVYRELSAELQASKAMLDSLHQQNQQLARQNQQFRQEIERLSASVLNLQQIAGLSQPGWVAPTRVDQEDAGDSTPPIRPVAPPASQSPSKPSPSASKSKAQPSQPAISEAHALANSLRFTEQPSSLPVGDLSESNPRDLSGLWLWFTVLAIIITAFGAGFMVVRPLLPSGNR
ncbi:MAG: hypothetical protein SNJ57_03445 [Cyanobacteriota bacterium]